jgi:hypothetical protein
MAKKVKQPKLYELREGPAEAKPAEGTIHDLKTGQQQVIDSVMVQRTPGVNIWQNAFWRSPKSAKTPYAFVEHVPQASQNNNG